MGRQNLPPLLQYSHQRSYHELIQYLIFLGENGNNYYSTYIKADILTSISDWLL